MSDNTRQDACARIATALESLLPEERERLFEIVDAAAKLVRSERERTVSAADEKSASASEAGPSCYFSGVLAEDGARLQPHDHNECAETLRRLTGVERKFWGDRGLGTTDASASKPED